MMGHHNTKQIWFVNIQQIYEGYFYVAASSAEMARRLAWAHYERGNEPAGVGSRPGYLVDAHPIGESDVARHEIEIDVDEDDPRYATVSEVPEVF